MNDIGISKDKVNIQRVFKNNVLYIDDELRVEYVSGKLFFKNNSDHKLLKKIYLCETFKDKVLANINFLERLLRFEPRYLNRLTSNIFILSNCGALYLIDIKSGVKQKVFDYVRGTRNPLHFCLYERHGDKEIVFGDYGGHDKNGDVGIYKYVNKEVKQISSISGKKINHIHSVEYDKYRDCYWIFTGDTDSGSGIWRLGQENDIPEPFLIGSQQYRACVAFINKKTIVYATDSPIERNHIYSLDIDSKRLRGLANIPGSCIYGVEKSNYDNSKIYYFATTVEPDSTLPWLMYIITNKLGEGIMDRYVHLIKGNMSTGFKDCWQSKKDWMPMLLFQFGNVRFPIQNTMKDVFFCPQSCVDKGTYLEQKSYY